MEHALENGDGDEHTFALDGIIFSPLVYGHQNSLVLNFFEISFKHSFPPNVIS